MPTLRAIVDDWYDKAWGAHKSGRKGLLPELERSPLMWRSSSPWKCEPGDVHFSNTKESSYTSKLPRLDTRTLEQHWRSVRLGLSSRGFVGEEQLNPLIPRMNSKNVVKRVKARVKSSGMNASMVLRRELASVADNTLFIKGTLEDGSPLSAAVWFERATVAWRLQSWCGIVVKDTTNHPSLHGIYEHPNALTLDNGLNSLSFGEPIFIESSVVVAGSATTIPVLAGAHYYVGFRFGPNLQRAVRKRTPLVLIGNQMNANAWRSTPFDLSFTDLELRNCTLLIKTHQLDDGGTLVWDSRCYLEGRGLGGQRYRTELGSDNCILRWNLQLSASLDYDPADVHETDSPQNAELAGAEEDFFLDSPATYPPLQKLERYDAWLGGAAWRSGNVTSEIYGSLAEAQFLHLQFGIARPLHDPIAERHLTNAAQARQQRLRAEALATLRPVYADTRSDGLEEYLVGGLGQLLRLQVIDQQHHCSPLLARKPASSCPRQARPPAAAWARAAPGIARHRKWEETPTAPGDRRNGNSGHACLRYAPAGISCSDGAGGPSTGPPAPPAGCPRHCPSPGPAGPGWPEPAPAA
nr:hypothetical protein [Pseudomonas putida]